MVLERREEDEYFAPRAGSIAAGLASPAPSPASAGFDEFAPPSSSGMASGRGSGSGRGGARGGGGGRGRGRGKGRGSSRGGLGVRSSGGRDDFEVTRPAQPAKRARKEMEYFPRKPRGGATALLGQLFIFEQQGIASADIDTLQTQAQRFCDEPMKAPSGPFTSKAERCRAAWKSMSLLVEKQLVKKNARGGRKHTFNLLPTGRELAGRVVEEYSDTFAGFINTHGNNNNNDDDDDDDDDDNSLFSNPFAPPRRTVAAAAGAASTVSPGSSFYVGRPPSKSKSKSKSGVQNPYASSRSNTTAVRALAAEARRAKGVNSKAAAVAAMRPVGASGTKGTEKFEKKARLYDTSGDGGSPLLAGLKHFDPTPKKRPTTSKGAGPAAPAAPAAPTAAKKARHNVTVADGLVGLDDEVMTLKSRPVPVRPVLTPSSPPPRLGAVPTSNPRQTAPGPRPRASSKPRASDASAVPRWAAAAATATGAPSPKPPSATVSVGGESRSQRGERTSGGSGSSSSGRGAASAVAAATAATEDVVDISLSDDEDNGGGGDGAGDDGDGDDVMMVPPPDRSPLVVSSASSASFFSGRSPPGGGGGGGGSGGGSSGARGPAGGRGGGDEGVRGRGPGDGGVVPLPCPFRSLSRTAGAAAAAAAAGSSQSYSGAMDWRGRSRPDWLQRELDMGTVRETDRMVDVFDLVLIVDCSEKHDQVRAPIHAKLQSFLSKPSLSRAGLSAVPLGGIGLEMQVAKLQVGDFAWAWRRRRRRRRRSSSDSGTTIDAGAHKEMLLLDCVVERKKDEDIVSSVEGATNRYRSQKRRMRLSGLSRLIYLLEGDLAGYRKATTGQDKSKTIRSSEASTLAEGFVLKRVESVQETAEFILSLSVQLMGSQGVETIEEFCNNASRPKVSVQEWNVAMQPPNFEPASVNVLFAKCLSEAENVGPAGALAIAREFRTPAGFVEALRGCTSRVEQCGLVKRIKLADGGKKGSVNTVGPTAAGKLVSLFTDEPEV